MACSALPRPSHPIVQKHKQQVRISHVHLEHGHIPPESSPYGTSKALDDLGMLEELFPLLRHIDFKPFLQSGLVRQRVVRVQVRVPEDLRELP